MKDNVFVKTGLNLLKYYELNWTIRQMNSCVLKNEFLKYFNMNLKLSKLMILKQRHALLKISRMKKV